MIVRRVTVAAVGVLAAVIALTGVLFVRQLEDRLVGGVDDDLRDRIEQLVRVPDRDDRARMPDGALLPAFAVQELVVMRLDDDGAVVGAIASGPATSPSDLPDVAALATDGRIRTVENDTGEEFRAIAIDLDDGSLVAGLSLNDVDATLRRTQRTLIVVGLAGIGVAALLVWGVIRRGLQPVDAMVTTADRIAAGDLDQRAPVGDGDDEFTRLSQSLNTMLDRITDAVAAKTASEEQMRRFLADASHELRTPLTSIRGYAELYRQGGGDGGEAEAVARIEHEATRMTGLVDELLLLARLDQGRTLATDPVDLPAVVGDAVDAARTRRSDATIDLDLPAEPVVVTGDAGRLRQVIDNLLANVAAHAGDGAAAEVAVRAAEDHAVIEVVDHGVGMDAEQVRRARTRFWRAAGDGSGGGGGGAGLGLAIVDEIVRAHGGSLDVRSAVGRGTTVTVSLPRTGD